MRDQKAIFKFFDRVKDAIPYCNPDGRFWCILTVFTPIYSRYFYCAQQQYRSS